MTVFAAVAARLADVDDAVAVHHDVDHVTLAPVPSRMVPPRTMRS
jgi:hypothetical protein